MTGAPGGQEEAIGPVGARPRARKDVMMVTMFGLGLRWCRRWIMSGGQRAKSRCKGTEVSSSEGPEGRSEDAPANSGMVEKALHGPCCLP